jgi:hypothetical protein
VFGKITKKTVVRRKSLKNHAIIFWHVHCQIPKQDEGNFPSNLRGELKQ